MSIRPSEPHVSVCVVAFNQAEYIRQCLDSLITQDVTFPFEIIVGDDASTDGTSEIIADYGNRFPDLVFPVLHSNNIGAIANIISVYEKARGTYIAHMDGDDYAAPTKLDRQAASLDSNPDCALCTHEMLLVDREGIALVRQQRRKLHPQTCTSDYLIKHLPFFAHSSKMFRNDSARNVYSLLRADSVDFEIHLHQLSTGKIFHIAERLGFYRVGAGIATSGAKINPILPRAVRRTFEGLLANNTTAYSRSELLSIYASHIFRYGAGSLLLGDLVNGKEYVNESIRIKIFSLRQLALWLFYASPRFVQKWAHSLYILRKNGS